MKTMWMILSGLLAISSAQAGVLHCSIHDERGTVIKTENAVLLPLITMSSFSSDDGKYRINVRATHNSLTDSYLLQVIEMTPAGSEQRMGTDMISGVSAFCTVIK